MNKRKVSKMDGHATLLDVLDRLKACQSDLDEIGAKVAAAHLSACLDALVALQPADPSSPISD